MRRDKIVIFGNVKIITGYCRQCERESFVLSGKLSCCESEYQADPTVYTRESEPQYTRKPLRKALKLKKLLEQQNRCFYCDRQFGSYIIKKNRAVKLIVNYDHQVPYSYSANNREENFVAACHICNGMKSNLCFSTADEARIYLLQEWERFYSEHA